MALDPKTEELIRELFAGRQCALCGSPAARMIDDRFYCHRHFRPAMRGPKTKPSVQAPCRPPLEPPPSSAAG